MALKFICLLRSVGYWNQFINWISFKANSYCYQLVNVISFSLSLRDPIKRLPLYLLGTVKLGYNELGYNELPVIMNKLFSSKSMCYTINYPSYNDFPVIANKFCRHKRFVIYRVSLKFNKVNLVDISNVIYSSQIRTI